jgi:hypothetical protein
MIADIGHYLPDTGARALADIPKKLGAAIFQKILSIIFDNFFKERQHDAAMLHRLLFSNIFFVDRLKTFHK